MANSKCLSEQEMMAFISSNYHRYTNKELSQLLGVKLFTVRRPSYDLGIKRMELEYFSPEQVSFLKKHFKTTGDSELAEIFQRKWPKQKGWSKKHIEKKRKYLGLNRNPKEIKKIHQRNVKAGRFKICPKKAWDKRGRAPDSTIHYWKHNKTGHSYPVIKFQGKFIQWARWAWERKFGSIAKDKNIVFKDGNPYNLNIANLEILLNGELSRRNSKKSSQGLSDNYVAGLLTHKDPFLRNILIANPKLLEVKRKQLTLNRIIYNNKKFLKDLDAMVGKTFHYGNNIHCLLSYKLDEEKQHCIIKTNMNSCERSFGSIEEFLSYWVPATTMPLLQNEQDKASQIMLYLEQGNSRSDKLIELLEDNIAKVKTIKITFPRRRLSTIISIPSSTSKK